MPDRIKSRIAGIIFAILGIAAVAWTWLLPARRAHPRETIPPRPGRHLYGRVDRRRGPELPTKKLSPLGWVFLVLGLVVGVLFSEFLKTGRLAFLG